MPRRPFPRVADSASDRHDHIVACATELIAHEGLESLSVRTVAARAGCSRGLVEHYFRCKAELVRAANLRVNETYLRRVADVTAGLTGLAALEVRLRNLLPFDQERLDEWRVRVVFWRQASTDAALLDDHNDSFQVAYAEILADMQHAQAHGDIPPSVPVIESSEMVLLWLIGLATACLSEERLRETRPLERRITMIMGLLRSGSLGALAVGDPAVEF